MPPEKIVSPPDLRAFFARLVLPGFAELGIADRAVSDYVIDLLARFARTDQLYRIRDARGQQIETIAEMLVELARQHEPERRWAFDRAVEIRRHVGDYALFSSGLFRAWVERQGLANLFCRAGAGSIRGGGGHGPRRGRQRQPVSGQTTQVLPTAATPSGRRSSAAGG